MKQETAYKLLIISFAIVYIAFGVPKILGATSVKDLMQAGYPFFNDAIIGFMGIVEIILGFCLIVKKTRSLALYILSKENTIKLPQFLNKANGSNQN